MGREIDELMGPDETVLLETRQHPLVIAGEVLAWGGGAALMAIAASWAEGSSTLDNQVGGWLVVALWIVTALLLVRMLWAVLGWFVERLYVTTNKVVHVEGILGRDVTSTPLSRLEELTMTRPLIGRVFGFGRLVADNAGQGEGPLDGLRYVPKVGEIYQLITHSAREQRMHEGGARRPEATAGAGTGSAAGSAAHPATAPDPTPVDEDPPPPDEVTGGDPALDEAPDGSAPDGEQRS